MNVPVVLIGFYITIMSIFGSNSSPAIVDISKNNLSDKFIKYIKNALIAAFIYFLLTIFFDVFVFKFYIFIYSSNFLWVIVSMIRITYITIKLYSYNIKNANNELNEKNKSELEMITLLREIKDLNNKTDNKYYEKLKAQVQKQKESAKDIPYDEDI